MPTETTPAPERDPVIQLSVFADNKVGRLNELIQRLGARDIHVMAFSQLDSTECTIMRFIVDYTSEAKDMLNAFGYAFSETEVVAVEIARESRLREVTSALVEAEINIHYIYSFITRPNGASALACCSCSEEDTSYKDGISACC